MKFDSFVDRYSKFTVRLSTWFEYIAIIALLGMMVATLIDVIGAKAFTWPLPAGLEAVFFCQLIAISAALAYAEIDERHIKVDLFVNKLPLPVKAFFHGFAAFLGLALFVVLTWKSFQYGLSLKAVNDVTATSRIPLYPFAFWLGISFIPLCLVLTGEILKAALEGLKK